MACMILIPPQRTAYTAGVPRTCYLLVTAWLGSRCPAAQDVLSIMDSGQGLTLAIRAPIAKFGLLRKRCPRSRAQPARKCAYLAVLLIDSAARGG